MGLQYTSREYQSNPFHQSSAKVIFQLEITHRSNLASYRKIFAFVSLVLQDRFVCRQFHYHSSSFFPQDRWKLSEFVEPLSRRHVQLIIHLTTIVEAHLKYVSMKLIPQYSTWSRLSQSVLKYHEALYLDQNLAWLDGGEWNLGLFYDFDATRLRQFRSLGSRVKRDIPLQS